MTEAEWLACGDPEKMLDFLLDPASGRKSRLFAVACCRRIQHAFPNRVEIESRLDVAERCAEGEADEHDMLRAMSCRLGGPRFGDFGHEAVAPNPQDAAKNAQSTCLDAIRAGLTQPQPGVFGRLHRFFTRGRLRAIRRPELAACSAERVAQCNLLRDIFGNPCRPVTFDSAWRTSDAVLLARGIYDDRAFDRMPILADALQDAGCTSDDILGHLRDPHATHVRGCWALDLVLGKQ